MPACDKVLEYYKVKAGAILENFGPKKSIFSSLRKESHVWYCQKAIALLDLIVEK